MMANRSCGFTLVEVVVVLLVMAVLLAVAAPSLSQLRERMAALQAFHGLTTALAQARMSAIERGRPVTVCPSADGRHCRADLIWDAGWLVYADALRGPQPADDSQIIWVEQLSPGQISIRSTAGRQRVRYQPTGFSGGNNISLRLCNRRGLLLGSVIVSMAGRARSARVSPGLAAPCPFPP